MGVFRSVRRLTWLVTAVWRQVAFLQRLIWLFATGPLRFLWHPLLSPPLQPDLAWIQPNTQAVMSPVRLHAGIKTRTHKEFSEFSDTWQPFSESDISVMASCVRKHWLERKGDMVGCNFAGHNKCTVVVLPKLLLAFHRRDRHSTLYRDMARSCRTRERNRLISMKFPP